MNVRNKKTCPMMNELGETINLNLCKCTSFKIKILKYKGLHGP